MRFVPQQLSKKHTQSFHGFFNPEFLVIITIYAIYFGVMFPLSKKMSELTGWSSGLIVFLPAAACHLSACIWLMLHQFWGKNPKTKDTSGCAIFVIGSGLLAIVTLGAALFGIIFKIGFWLGWWH